MADDQLRSDMEALMTRLVETERALMDTLWQIAAAPKAAAPLVDSRTIGKAPTFTGEQRLARVAIAIHFVHGTLKAQVD